jgi:hypothetical protein
MTYEEMWNELKLSTYRKWLALNELSKVTAETKEHARLIAKTDGVRLIMEDMTKLEES